MPGLRKKIGRINFEDNENDSQQEELSDVERVQTPEQVEQREDGSHKAQVEQAPTAEDDISKWTALAKAMNVITGKAEQEQGGQKGLDLKKFAEKLKSKELSDDELKVPLEQSNDPDVLKAMEKDPGFIEKLKRTATDSAKQAELMNKISEKGAKAKEYALKEIGGPAGMLIGQIEKNPQAAIGCAIAGVLGLMMLAKRDKSIGQWVGGLALSGISTYFGLEMFGKTEAAKKFFAEKFNEVILDPQGKGKAASQALKTAFEKGVNQIFGEDNVKEVLAFLAPFAKDIPGMDWVQKMKEKKESENKQDSGRATPKEESLLEQEVGRETEEDTLEELKVTEDDREVAENLSSKLPGGASAISANEVAMVRMLPFSSETGERIAKCIETGEEEDRQRAYDSFFKNELSNLIITGGKNVLLGVAAGAVSLEKILLIKHFSATKEVIKGYTSADEGDKVWRAARKYVVNAAEFSLAFGSRELMRKFVFGSGRGLWEMLRVTAKESALWPYYGVKNTKDLLVGVYRGGKYVADHGATNAFKKLLTKRGARLAGSAAVRYGGKKVIEKGAMKVAGKTALKFIPYLGTMMLAYDAGAILDDVRVGDLETIYGEAGKILKDEIKNRRHLFQAIGSEGLYGIGEKSGFDFNPFRGSMRQEGDLREAIEATNERIIEVNKTKTEDSQLPIFEIPEDLPSKEAQAE